jgi:hypothetical protein
MPSPLSAEIRKVSSNGTRLHEELPYRSTVETDQWQVRPDGSVRIEQTIFVERESQRLHVQEQMHLGLGCLGDLDAGRLPDRLDGLAILAQHDLEFPTG